MRGKQRKYDGISRILRITPAGAGKTKSFSRDVSAGQDHPRRCGENHFALTIFCTISGSPPQVRGKHNIRKHARYRIRITPAGAGKTLSSAVTLLLVRDHPRRCGENHCTPSPRLNVFGSPPQVRGKQISFDLFSLRFRITPAGAGKTAQLHTPHRCCKDHPRRCGENLSQSNSGIGESGSPPQVRGKRRSAEKV